GAKPYFVSDRSDRLNGCPWQPFLYFSFLFLCRYIISDIAVGGTYQYLVLIGDNVKCSKPFPFEDGFYGLGARSINTQRIFAEYPEGTRTFLKADGLDF